MKRGKYIENSPRMYFNVFIRVNRRKFMKIQIVFGNNRVFDFLHQRLLNILTNFN